MFKDRRTLYLISALKSRPNAVAELFGSREYPEIRGTVRFYQTRFGVIVATEVSGLPSMRMMCSAPVFGFHIHEGDSCTGNADDPFADVLTHYDPHGCPHPYHAGDLAPLFGASGYAMSVFLSDRFAVKEVIGRTVIIHSMPDDFTTQPSGNSGKKIACGVIK
ncbi:MAG: superoxide dismutase family protein [Clostridia bacterium]|nr:superoxide dismutase family protein [Clostridia bacterium]